MIYEPYPHRHRKLVRALYLSLRKHLISRVEFAAMIQIVMGRHR